MSSYLITGGTGLVGRALIAELLKSDNQVTVLTRSAKKASTRVLPSVLLVEKLSQIPSSTAFDYVVNLAGEPIADKRWSRAQKDKLWASRVDLTRELVDWIKQHQPLPKALISGSAVGWYGDGKDQLLTEESVAHPEYTHSLCQAWESEALQLSHTGVRVCVIRTGLIIHPTGGFLQKLLPSFKFFLGAKLGTGQQYMSWIHIEDMINALLFLMTEHEQGTTKQPLQGVYNLCSPTPVTNSEFTNLVATQLKRPSVLVVPKLCLRLLLGEMARILTTGQRVTPLRLSKAGFTFHYPTLKKALRHTLANSQSQKLS